MPFLIFLGAVVVLIINYFIAKEFYNVAVDKGYSSIKYLWLSFFFGAVGYLLVVALPNKNQSTYYASQATGNQISANASPQYNDLPEL